MFLHMKYTVIVRWNRPIPHLLNASIGKVHYSPDIMKPHYYQAMISIGLNIYPRVQAIYLAPSTG